MTDHIMRTAGELRPYRGRLAAGGGRPGLVMCP